jgi:hypothetical protein
MPRSLLLLAIIFVSAAIACTVADDAIAKWERDGDCRSACSALDARMSAVGTYGCICRDEDGPFVLGEQDSGE